ncbi:MAG: DUF6036 family nucleotidyltransferase [Burkholderiales bacterium]
MKRHELEHIIRAATQIANEYELVVIGSQSILGAFPNAAQELLMSMEADVYPRGAEDKSILIDGAIGEGSLFHETHGFYAQGVDSSTATLPDGWESRLVRIQNTNTEGRVGFCLDPTDLFLAKSAAAREKDRLFNVALLIHGYVKLEEALRRVADMPVTASKKKQMEAFIRRAEGQARERLREQ